MAKKVFPPSWYAAQAARRKNKGTGSVKSTSRRITMDTALKHTYSIKAGKNVRASLTIPGKSGVFTSIMKPKLGEKGRTVYTQNRSNLSAKKHTGVSKETLTRYKKLIANKTRVARKRGDYKTYAQVKAGK